MRWKKVLGIGAIVVALGGVGAAGIALLTYHEVTKIDRSDPEVVTDEYLRAVLVRKDDVGAELYSCSNQERLAPIRQLREELDQRERDFGVSILVSWGAYQHEGDNHRAFLTLDLTVAALKDGAEQSSSDQRWQFTVVEEDGWRVCGAVRVEHGAG